MKKYLNILLALAIFTSLANAAAVTKPKTPEPEDSSEDEPKASLTASSHRNRSPKEGVGDGGDSRSELPGGRGEAGSTRNGAGGSSSSATGGKAIIGSGSQPKGSGTSPGDVAKEQKPQGPKNTSEKVAPKKLGESANKNHSATAVTGKVAGGDSSNASGEEVSANRKSGSGTSTNKEGSRRNLHDGGNGRRNSSSPAISVHGSGGGSCPSAKNSGPATIASPQKPQEAPKKRSDKVSLPTSGGGERGGSVSGATVEGPGGVPDNSTGGGGRPSAASGSGGGAMSANSGRTSNGGATRGTVSRTPGSGIISRSSGQVPSDKSTVAEGAGASSRIVRKPARSPLPGGRSVDSGSRGRGGSSSRPASGYAPGVSPSDALGVEDNFPAGLGASVSGATSDDVLSGTGRGLFPSGLGEGSPRRVPSRGPVRGTSEFGGSDFGSPISGSSGFGQSFPAGLGQESAVGSSGIAGGSPGGSTFGSADSRFGSRFSGSSFGGAGRGGRERSGRARFPGRLSGGFDERGSSSLLPGRGLPTNGISSGRSGPGQEFPEGLGGGSFGGTSRGVVASHQKSTPAPGSYGSGVAGLGHGPSVFSPSRGKPGASRTAATVLGTLAGAAAVSAIGAGLAAVVQGQGGQSKPAKRGPSRSCRRRCKGRKLCLAFCRRERRSIPESKVPEELLDQIPLNFERMH